MSGSNSGNNEPVTTGTRTVTSNVRQLSDGNGLRGGPGTVLGQGPTDLIGFYGSAPVVQPTGYGEVAITRGAGAGIISTIEGASTSLSSVATLTTAEQTIVLTTAAGSNFQIAATDLLFANKPTSQAGLAVGNVRCANGNTLSVTLGNLTTTVITPTASQSWSVVAFRNFTNTTATLTPAAIGPTSVIEQQFTLANVRAGDLLQVNKPSAQAGMDIYGCRVVGDGVIGISFANVTATTITPTAGEVYNIISTQGIDAIDNDLLVQSLQSPASVAANTSAEQSLTITGLLATDAVVGVSKPTAQAGLVVAGQRVASANTLGLTFGNLTAVAITPTASQTYDVTIVRLAPASPLIVSTPTLTPAAVAPNTTAEQTFAVSGLIAAAPVWVNKPSNTLGLGIAGVRVSAAGTLAINYVNVTAGTITPPAEAYTVGAFQLPYGDASSTWTQTADNSDTSTAQLTNNLRSALLAVGLISGV